MCARRTACRVVRSGHVPCVDRAFTQARNHRSPRIHLEFQSHPRALRRPLVVVALLALASCVANVAAPDVGAEIARTIDTAGTVELRAEGGAYDAAVPVGAALSLRDAVALCVDRDAGLQAALARVRVALADARQARLLPNPILSLVLRVPDGGGRTQIDAGITSELVDILKRPGRVDAADRRLEASIAQALVVALDLVVELRERYAESQAFDELLPLVRARAALLDRLVDLAQARLEFGEGARVDVTTLRGKRVELDIDIAELQRRQRQARIALARLIGVPSGASDWQLDAWAPLPALAKDERTWIEAALARRPEMHAALLELAALGDDAALAALAKWDGTTLGLAAERGDGWALGPSLALPLPLFDMGDARRAKASAQIVAARHELVDLGRGVIEQVRRAHVDFSEACLSLERVRDTLIPLQRDRRREVEDTYLAGHTDVTALLLAEQDLRQTEARLVELEERAAVSLARLERAVGGPAVARDVIEDPNRLPTPPTQRR